MFVTFTMIMGCMTLSIDKPGMKPFHVRYVVNEQIPTWADLRDGFNVYCEFPIAQERRWLTLSYEGSNTWEVEVCLNEEQRHRRICVVQVPTESLAMLVDKVNKNDHAQVTLADIIKGEVPGAVIITEPF